MADYANSRVSIDPCRAASEVTLDGVRLAEECQTAQQWLRRAQDEGERSGAATEFNFDAYLARRRRASEA